MPSNNAPPPVEIGKTYGRITVLSFHHSDKRWRKHYECRCACGNAKIIQGTLLKSGNTKSCGCLSTEVKKAKRISDNHSEVTAIILGYKRHAEDRGYKWELSREEVYLLINKPCFYCGCPPNNIKRTKNSLGNGLLYSGIDRKDNKGDYTVLNSVPCCRICNYAKSNMNTREFYNWAKQLNAMAEQWG
jgi:hypothetical protein